MNEILLINSINNIKITCIVPGVKPFNYSAKEQHQDLLLEKINLACGFEREFMHFTKLLSTSL